MDETRRFCTHCGGSLEAHTAPARFVCALCQRVSYRNPAVGVAVVITAGERVLLGRRARGPYAGRWCIPCGYVEWDEDVRAAARREMIEETGLEVEVGEVCAVHSNFHDPAKQTVGVWFWGRIIGGALRPGDDVDAVDYHPVTTPPPLAFPTDALVLDALRERLTRP
jgi:ADP-ribose pyrophosphatase YjhB (NUDIX family)